MSGHKEGDYAVDVALLVMGDKNRILRCYDDDWEPQVVIKLHL